VLSQYALYDDGNNDIGAMMAATGRKLRFPAGQIFYVSSTRQYSAVEGAQVQRRRIWQKRPVERGTSSTQLENYEFIKGQVVLLRTFQYTLFGYEREHRVSRG
jgi:hypothetical protein